MKFLLEIVVAFLILPPFCMGQASSHPEKPLKFAVVTDTHIGKNKNGVGLQEIVTDINNNPQIEFVLHAGDISDFGYDDQLKESKRLLDGLNVPYFIVPGNHDTGWSSSGSLIYDKLWKEQRFIQDIDEVRFIGFSTGPFGRMSRGYVPKDQIRWLDSLVTVTSSETPVVFLTHYPLDKGMSNYEEVIEIMKKVNTIAVLVGHGHRNKLFNFSGVPGIMTRTAQSRDGSVGYNVMNLTLDSLQVQNVDVGQSKSPNWASLSLPVDFSEKGTTNEFEQPQPDQRPAIPSEYKGVAVEWSYHDEGNIVSSPTIWNENVLYGNLLGDFKSLNPAENKVNWIFKTGQAIYSSPAISGDYVVFGSADSTVYNLDAATGKLNWKFKTKAPVLGSPVIYEGKVIIGSSEPSIRSFDLKTGRELWNFTDIEGFPASKPSVANGKVIFGTWGKSLYSLDTKTGKLLWKWKNDDYSHYYSPAMVIPVIINEKVYIVAPDEILREFDLETGEQTFTTDRFRVRESLGGSEELEILVAKTMQDSVVVWTTQNGQPELLFNIDAGFGNDFSASMPVIKGGMAYFGTTFGRVYSVNLEDKKIKWAFQLSQDMINTVVPLSEERVLATGVDGKVAILKGSPK